MKHDKRTSVKLLATASGLSLARWLTPSVVAISLPAHAQTSLCDGLTLELAISFTEATCADPSFCDGLTDQEIIDRERKPGPSENFCISNTEISESAFRRDVDLDGGGPAADFLSVFYTIDSINDAQASGTVTSANVDTLITLTGEWTATIS